MTPDWIAFGDDGTVSLDDSQLVAWVDGIEATVDSVGGTRTYTRPNDGQTFTVSGGNYGWISDGAALEDLVRNAVYNGQVGSVDIPTKQTAATYNPGGADWSGSNWIDVDLGEQHVRYFDAWGNVLWESDCISGAYGTHDTPTGAYYIYNKALDQTLLGNIDPETGKREYETPVQYWIPFNDGVGLHERDDHEAAAVREVDQRGEDRTAAVDLRPLTAAAVAPVGLGWHPYFPKRERSRLDIAVTGRWDSDATHLPVFNQFEGIAIDRGLAPGVDTPVLLVSAKDGEVGAQGGHVAAPAGLSL